MIQKPQPFAITTDPSWVNLVKYIQAHPFCKLKELEFKEGKPFMARVAEESVKF